MMAIVSWYEAFVGNIPLPILQVWGRFAYIVGFVLAICAFGGFTFRVGDHWGFGRARQTWDTKAFLSLPITSAALIATSYIGSFIVLVPGAQTFESLKDLSVLLCIVLFGYPALIAIPPAYMLADLIEGVPPDFVLNWAEGYFFWTAFVWMAYQLIGRNPDFRRVQIWWRYGVFVALIMFFDPVMWGFICSGKFTSSISYRNITSALAFTLSVTWLLGPVAFLIALPLTRRFGWFWAEIPGHVRERAIGNADWTWVSGRNEKTQEMESGQEGLPIRIYIFTPFVVLLLVMVGATAIVALQSADDDAIMLAARLHKVTSTNIRMRLDDELKGILAPIDAQHKSAVVSLLQSQASGTNGRAFLIDSNRMMIASSAPDGDPVVRSAVAALAERSGAPGPPAAAVEFQFDHVTEKPLSRETWLAYAAAYRDDSAGRVWTLVTAMPEAFYLQGLRVANSRSAMVFALALVLSLMLAALLASVITAPLRRMAQAARTMARGDLNVKVPGSKLWELDVLTSSFNEMADRLKTFLDKLVDEVEMRKHRERELKESEVRLRASEERVRLAVEAAELGIWDWEVERDRLVWDDSMYRLYGVRKEEFGGAFDAWSQCIVPEDFARANADVEAALRGNREFASDFRVRRGDGAVRIIRGIAQTIRNAEGKPVRMVGINRDVTDLINAEREHEQLMRVSRLTTMGELAASIAHEINQPLAAVVAFGNGALRWLAHTPPNLDETKSAIKGIVAEGSRAGEVIDRIRELLKHRKPEYISLDVNEAIRDVIALTGSALRSRAVEVQAILPTELPLAVGDRVQLQQVIMNLVMNGADAMGSVTDRSRILSIGAKVDDDGNIQVTIGDSGIGIDAANLHRIFDTLFTTKSAGMGMGLSICRSIVEAHGGRIWASPRTPHGTDVQFTIPIVNRPNKSAG